MDKNNLNVINISVIIDIDFTQSTIDTIKIELDKMLSVLDYKVEILA